jgi:predicted O-methyltransferase YrrM
MDGVLMAPKMLQHEAEIAAFVEVLVGAGVRSYLEVGSKFGGSLWRVGSVLPPKSRIVSIDLGSSGPEAEKSLTGCVAELRAKGHDAHLLWGDSTAPSVVNAVKNLGPFDAAFIDANHTEPYVRRDYANYSPLATMLIAFHDIAWHRPAGTKVGYHPIQVPKVWAELREGHEHTEIKLDPTGRDNGIGILWVGGKA